jgi:hypothetical protein
MVAVDGTVKRNHMLASGVDGPAPANCRPQTADRKLRQRNAPAHAEERRPVMDDILLILSHRIDSTLKVSKPASEWKSIFIGFGLPFPPHLDSATIEQEEKSMKTKERTILHTMIAALANESIIDIKKAHKAAKIIVAAADRAGFTLAVSTVEGYIKSIRIHWNVASNKIPAGEIETAAENLPTPSR